jgi:hypothetical protein
MSTKFWYWNLNGRGLLEDPGIYGRILLTQILRSRVGEGELDSFDSGQGLVAGCCEHGNEHSDSTKGRQFPH